jgi:hypothetical protein
VALPRCRKRNTAPRYNSKHQYNSMYYGGTEEAIGPVPSLTRWATEAAIRRR